MSDRWQRLYSKFCMEISQSEESTWIHFKEMSFLKDYIQYVSSEDSSLKDSSNNSIDQSMQSDSTNALEDSSLKDFSNNMEIE